MTSSDTRSTNSGAEDALPAPEARGSPTGEDMYALVGRAVTDARFRRKLLADPEAAALEAGYRMTGEQLAALRSAERDGLAEELEERLRNMAVRARAIRSQRAAPAGEGPSGSGSTLEVAAQASAGKPRVALVYAPFGACTRPPLGIALLKAASARDGIPCDVHYLNLALAAEFGVRLCDLIAREVRPELQLGEWLFAPSLLGHDASADAAYAEAVLWGEYREAFTPAIVRGLLAVREQLPAFLDRCVERVDWPAYDLIGFSTSFQQNCASLALARRIKSRHPGIPIVFGGANCFAMMGEAVLRLFPFVDFVCTGYADAALPALVKSVVAGIEAPHIAGMLSRGGRMPARDRPLPVDDLDALPYPDYSDYLEQLSRIPSFEYLDVHLQMEASRGCWWGEKCQCTFCGQNFPDLAYRYKSPSHMLDELRYLRDRYGNKIDFVDNILPLSYFDNVMPELARETGIATGWEVRANLSREQVALLARAGADWIQPGIETLSDRLLRLIGKGTTLADAVQVLKWAKELGVRVVWNVLWGFPGEEEADYAAMETLIPLLTHLDPPFRYGHLRFERFSPYWNTPAAYGILRLEPLPSYRYTYHSLPQEDVRDLAYYFHAEYPDHSAIYTKGLARALCEWQARSGASLDAFASGDGVRIVDTREPSGPREVRLDGHAAALYLLCDGAQTVSSILQASGFNERATESEVPALLDQFVEQGLMIRSGRRYVSLAVVRDRGVPER